MAATLPRTDDPVEAVVAPTGQMARGRGPVGPSDDDGPSVAAGRWWVLSTLVALILMVVVMLIWQQRDQLNLRQNLLTTDQLTTDEEVAAELEKAQDRPTGGQVRVSTGVFVQTMRLVTPTDVEITGYIWQSFPGDVSAEILAGGKVPTIAVDGTAVSVTPGFFLPDQVDSSFTLLRRYVHYNAHRSGGAAPQPPAMTTLPEPPSTTAAPPSTSPPTPPSTASPSTLQPPVTLPPGLFRMPANLRWSEGVTVVGWYFEAPLHQSPIDPRTKKELFSDRDFPFDHKVVRLRIWPAEFVENVILVPDFRSYPCKEQPTQNCTGEQDVFGIDTSIRMGDFTPKNTYFDYYLLGYYNSDFGLSSFRQENYPELQFNVLIRRNLPNAFVGNLVPFFVAAGLVFGVLLTIGGNSRRQRFVPSTGQITTTLAGIFLAVLIAHQQLRQQFAGVVYFDYLYFLLYLVLLGVSITALLFASPTIGQRRFFAFGDGLLPRVLYWPTLLLATAALAAALLR